VAGYDRNPGLYQIAIDHVQIGAADSAGQDSDSNLPGPRTGSRHLLESQLPVPSKDHGPHGAIVRRPTRAGYPNR
jgi:hypothetical protein